MTDAAALLLFLKKLLPLFALPLGVAFLLLALALLLKKRWPAVLAAVLLYVASAPPAGESLLSLLESRHKPVPLAAVKPADAVVVLGGYFGPVSEPGVLRNVSEASERMEAGIRLVQQGSAPLLVFSGARVPWDQRNLIEGERARVEAEFRGIPANRILVTGHVADTVDESRAIAQLARDRGWKNVLLVTSAWHMPRAARLFRVAGVPVTPFPVDYQTDPADTLTLLDFLPSAQGLATTEGTLRELYGIAFYALTVR